MWKTVDLLLKSRKAIATLLAIVVGTTLCLAGKVSPDDLLKYIGAMTALFVAATAHEDAAQKKAHITIDEGGSDSPRMQ